MELMTAELAQTIPPLYSTEDNADPTVVVKYFVPWNQWTWYVLEGEQDEDGDWLFFGRVKGHETELGYFQLSELESIRGPAGLGIERDLYFDPKPYSEIDAYSLAD